MLKAYFKIDFATVALVCLLLVIACNSGSSDTVSALNDNSATTTNMTSTPMDSTTISSKIDSSAPTNTAATKDACSKETTVVTIENMKFTPATITINKGDQVTFINKDIVAHNATETKSIWASPLLANGQSWTFTPEKTSDYYCTVHVVMRGRIIVK